MIKFEKEYEFNLFGIENYNISSRLIFFKNFFKKNLHLEGDYYEFGVYQGSSLISIALLFKKLGIKKKLYGFDSFGGFPNYSSFDDFKNFKQLFKKKLIKKSHYIDLINSKRIKKILNNLENNSKLLLPGNISSSKDFSNNSYLKLKKKIKILKLDNIVLVKGNFAKTIPKFFNKNHSKKILAANIDCDLYSSYKIVLSHIWKKVSKNGIIFLDEYYSLKFPGARIATNEFLKNKNIKLKKIKTRKSEFERWYIKK